MKNNALVIGLIGLLMVFGVFMLINSQKNNSLTQHSSNNDKSMVDSDIDHTFINDMIEHHMGAISMANEAQEKSRRSEIQTLTGNIIAAQEKEIAMMYDWKKNWFNDTEQIEINAGDHGTSMTQDLGVADKEFDLRFMNAMVQHHQGAIDMANDILKTTQREEVRTFANNIITDQTKEINQMNEWKKTWYNK